MPKVATPLFAAFCDASILLLKFIQSEELKYPFPSPLAGEILTLLPVIDSGAEKDKELLLVVFPPPPPLEKL